MIAARKLSMSHARTLSKLDDENEIIKMAHDIIQGGIPVRDTEKMTDNSSKKKNQKRARNTEYKYVEDLLREKLDTRVSIRDKKLMISFVNNADLNRILEILDVKE